MTTLTLQPNKALRAHRSDFGACVRDDRVELPADVVDLLARHRVRNVSQFLNLLRTFPTGVATELGWRLVELEEARGKLIKQLDGKLPTEVLHPPSRQPRVMGAHNPFRTP